MCNKQSLLSKHVIFTRTTSTILLMLQFENFKLLGRVPSVARGNMTKFPPPWTPGEQLSVSGSSLAPNPCPSWCAIVAMATASGICTSNSPKDATAELRLRSLPLNWARFWHIPPTWFSSMLAWKASPSEVLKFLNVSKSARQKSSWLIYTGRVGGRGEGSDLVGAHSHCAQKCKGESRGGRKVT